MNYFEFRKAIEEYSFADAVKLLTEWYLLTREWEAEE